MGRIGTGYHGLTFPVPGLVKPGELDESRTNHPARSWPPAAAVRRIRHRVTAATRPPLATLLPLRRGAPTVLALDELPRFGCRW